MSVMVRSCHACVNFVPWASFTSTLRSGSSPSPMRQRARPIACTKLPVDVREIFTCAHLKFTVYGRKQTDIHTISANAVTLVWGSPQLVENFWCTLPARESFPLCSFGGPGASYLQGELDTKDSQEGQPERAHLLSRR